MKSGMRITFFLLVAWLSVCSAQAAPTFAEVRDNYRVSDAQMLARDGRPLQSLRVDFTVRRLPWTRIEEISPVFLHALLVSEDKRFYEHSGVDWAAAASSAWRNLWNKKTRGASTLTMQLVSLLDENEIRQGRRSLSQKAGQAVSALWLERHWKKDEILEAYLNLVDFRGELQGIAAMSRGLFGKWPDGLDPREAALAAALVRAPNAAPQAVANRACVVLRAMGKPAVECEGLTALAQLAFSGGLRSRWFEREQSPDLAPHLARKLLRRPESEPKEVTSGEANGNVDGKMAAEPAMQTAGQDMPPARVRTTLDADLQRFASRTLNRRLSEIAPQNAEDGALVVIDNASGEIRAWVGSSGALSQAAEVDGVVALRQAGSTLKPMLFAAAIERGDLTAASLLEDAPLSLSADGGLYTPQNYVAQYRGWVSARMALGGSLNVPAVRVLTRIGPDLFRDTLRRYGLESLTEEGRYYGYSLALGGADVSLLALANAYRALANGGRWTPLKVTSDGKRRPCGEGGCAGIFADAAGVPAPVRQIVSPATAFIVADILSDRAARAGTFGLESWLATPYWSAVKTGTSKDMRDNWCIGFSRRYTVAVWVGNAAGEPMHDVSGISGAAPVWREVMDWLHRGEDGGGANVRPRVASPPPAPPPGVVARTIRFEPSGIVHEPPRREWFRAGSEREVIRLAERGGLAHIAYPSEGTVIAIDPDIPPQRQRVALRLSGKAGQGWQWRLDGRPLGNAGREILWLPQPGRHRLGLFDDKGGEIEAVAFEVRALNAGKVKR